MAKFLNKKITKFLSRKTKPSEKKVLITLGAILIFRFGNVLPLTGVDQIALKKAFLDQNIDNSIMQVINMYSGGTSSSNVLLTPFSLGIIPFINASILLDICVAIFPKLEKIQSEEGESGRQKILFYKKIVTCLFAIVQSSFLVFYLKPYLYNPNTLYYVTTITTLVTGAMLVVWLTSVIDNKGLGNGTSLIIFTNIVLGFSAKNVFLALTSNKNFFLQLSFLSFISFLILCSQTSRLVIPIVSARQLVYLEEQQDDNRNFFKDEGGFKFKDGKSGLSLRLNQAGIFPIIIASNVSPFIVSLNQLLFGIVKTGIANTVSYYFLLISFNYFYTTIFWDPQKISDQLRKSSVSIVNVTPGEDTVKSLEESVRLTSILGGISLCIIIATYDFMKSVLKNSLLNQINISSLIILIGISYDTQKVIRSLRKSE